MSELTLAGMATSQGLTPTVTLSFHGADGGVHNWNVPPAACPEAERLYHAVNPTLAATLLASGCYGKFSQSLAEAIAYAEKIAVSHRHGYIGASHLFLALTHDYKSLARRMLQEIGADVDSLREKTMRTMKARPNATNLDKPPTSDMFLRTMELATAEMRQQRVTRLDTGHVLVGIMDEGKSVPATLMAETGISALEARDAMKTLVPGLSAYDKMTMELG